MFESTHLFGEGAEIVFDLHTCEIMLTIVDVLLVYINTPTVLSSVWTGGFVAFIMAGGPKIIKYPGNCSTKKLISLV